MADMVHENKESVIAASILLYLGAYLLIGLGGLTFPAQPVGSYVQVHSDANSNCVTGAVWVQSNTLRWCADTDSEYKVVDEAGDQVSTNAVSAPAGALWVQGEDLHYMDAAGDTEYIVSGKQIESTSSPVGAVWLEHSPGIIHYIDSQGDEHTICSDRDPNAVCPDG